MRPDIKSFNDHILFLKGEIEKNIHRLPLNEKPEYLYDPIRYVLKGKGKRLRPILVHLSGQAFKADPENLMKGALAVELMHNFTLVHDDIMDQDHIRHGQPAVHKKWDNSAAILAGDGLFVLAQLLLSTLKPRIQTRFNEVTLTICEGQGMDKNFENKSHIQLEKYLEMISKKTGSLLGFCAELGGLLAGQNNSVLTTLNSYGISLGLAFQVQDDILEIYGEVENMGKSLGSDISAGKQTVLTIIAEKNDPENWKNVKLTGHKMEGENRIKYFRDYFSNHHIRSQAEKMVNNYINEAHEFLRIFPENNRENLQKFTDLILNRTF
ncbi:MAG: polyprenyl synthetase family protein [Candidatus Neomarinimicrobiota bacterium]